MGANTRDVHWVKLGSKANKKKNLEFNKSLSSNGYVNEYYLTSDSGKRVVCDGEPVKVQTLVQKVKVSALGEPSNNVRQLKKSFKVNNKTTGVSVLPQATGI